MTILITLRLHAGCIGGIFITGIFGNFYTQRGGEFLTSRTGIPGGLASDWGCYASPARVSSILKTHARMQDDALR